MTTFAATPTADATVSLIYPYDRTVFPQGLLAPLLRRLVARIIGLGFRPEHVATPDVQNLQNRQP